MNDFEQVRFTDPSLIREHALKAIDFYVPQCMDDNHGGFYMGYYDDGTVYDTKTKDLIGTARFIIDFALGNLLSESDRYSGYIAHGLKFLINTHRDEEHGGYYQLIDGINPATEKPKTAYGHAFVLAALCNALRVGVAGVGPLIEELYELLEKSLWENEHGLYAAEASSDFSKIFPYRGQNSNMHMTEALLTAYEVTGESDYLERAFQMAYKITQVLPKQSNGLIWEHYNSNWVIDPNYNKDRPEDIYRPYGFLPGHFLEWAKLLVILERYKPATWQLETACNLFDQAILYGWDKETGGFNYTFDFSGKVLDTNRYYWPHGEGIASAYLLASRTGNSYYLKWYEEFWDYALRNLIDEEYGGWYRVVDKKGHPLSNKKSIPGKTDYHVVSACYEIITTIKRT